MMDSSATQDKSKGSKNLPKPRRRFFTFLWWLLGTAAFIELGWIGRNVFFYKKDKKNSIQPEKMITAGKIEDFVPGSVSPVPQGPFFLSRLDDGGFMALSPRCTHLGCSVNWSEEKQQFLCPCHGSSFSITGEVTSFPATVPLDYHPVKIEDGQVIVDSATRKRRSSFSSSQVARI